MLDSVAEVMDKLSEIQGKISDEEFVKKCLHGIVSRQTYAAYKNGTRTVSYEFIDAATVIFPELHLLSAIAKDEIGREIIREAQEKVAK